LSDPLIPAPFGDRLQRESKAKNSVKNWVAAFAGTSGSEDYASIPRLVKIRSALSFHTSICTILPPRTTKRST